MSEKLIWSNTMTQDELYNMPEESLRAELVDYGYEEDMLSRLDYEGLQQLVLDDDYMWQNDSEVFEIDIAPKIAKQSKDGIVLLSGTAGNWQGSRAAGKAVQVEALVGGDICRDCDFIKLYDVDGNVVWEASHHDGTHSMGLYAIPEDEAAFIDFMDLCMHDYILDELDYNEDITAEEIIEDAYNNLDIDTINNYCDFSKASEACEPIKADLLREEVDQPIEEAKSKSPDTLAMELQSIKDDYEDFGPDGFYAVPFKRFEKEYPEFTKSCIRTYLKELEILTPEELSNDDIFEEYWQSGELIVPEDWPILIDGAERLSTDRADKGYTWITLLKKYQRPYDEKDESLEDDHYDDDGNYIGPESEYIDDQGYDTRTGEDKDANERAWKKDSLTDDESLTERFIYEEDEPEVIDIAPAEVAVAIPTEDIAVEVPQAVLDLPQTEDNLRVAIPSQILETANNVMAAYQNANKWLDSVKEAMYTQLSCVFFSSFIHELAHTMPVRFDKFGDILHTVNMEVPYPATTTIPGEVCSVDGAFNMLFVCLDDIKTALNEFIKISDAEYHGMACAAEELLNDIENEYPMLFRLQDQWKNCNGDVAEFDKYVGQYVEHKDELLA